MRQPDILAVRPVRARPARGARWRRSLLGWAKLRGGGRQCKGGASRRGNSGEQQTTSRDRPRQRFGERPEPESAVEAEELHSSRAPEKTCACDPTLRTVRNPARAPHPRNGFCVSGPGAHKLMSQRSQACMDPTPSPRPPRRTVAFKLRQGAPAKVQGLPWPTARLPRERMHRQQNSCKSSTRKS